MGTFGLEIVRNGLWMAAFFVIGVIIGKLTSRPSKHYMEQVRESVREVMDEYKKVLNIPIEERK